jgi:hypothetical protein
MPHVHLPAVHSEADLVLAANVAAVVGSEDLYVAWTHESGPGAVPEIEAVVREARPAPVVALARAFAAGVRAMWAVLTQPAPAPATTTPSPAREREPS